MIGCFSYSAPPQAAPRAGGPGQAPDALQARTFPAKLRAREDDRERPERRKSAADTREHGLPLQRAARRAEPFGTLDTRAALPSFQGTWCFP